MPSPTIKFTFHGRDADGEYEEEVELPAKFEVCPRCHGNGTHDHPAFANGFTADEWNNDWDYEEQEQYINGFYDVLCEKCKGERVVAVVNEVKADPEMVRAYHETLRERAEWAEEEAAERRMGA